MSEPRGRVRVEVGAKRVRALVEGVAVADTVRPVLVWEKPYYPTYYFPAADVRTDLLIENGQTSRSPSRGDATHFDLKVGDRVVADAGYCYPDSPMPELRDLVRLEWAAMDLWLEEDEPVIVHPRDPHTRIDILSSSRRVEVSLRDVVLADSDQPRILFETGLPPRFYLPVAHVRLDLLRRSDTVTQCPYKGTAVHWSALVGDESVPDVAWTYEAPLPESQKIAGLVAFYNERVDLTVDGQLWERPKTNFG